MIMAHVTKHTMTKLRSIVSELLNVSWHAFIHGSFEFGIVEWNRFIAESIDATLVRATTTTTVARSRVLSKTHTRGTTRRGARHEGKLGRAVGSGQVVTQSNGKVTRDKLLLGVGSSWSIQSEAIR